MTNQINDNGKEIALVTGGNRSIGREVVRKLAVLGFIVYLGSRSVEKGNKTRDEILAAHPGVEIRVVQLDIADKTSIINAAETISKETSGKLDILVNNAGIAVEFTKASKTDLNKIKETFDVNFYGVILTTQAFLPLLRNGTRKNIVNVSSSLGSLTETLNPKFPFYNSEVFAYSVSKTALNGFTAHLAVELKDEGFKINSINPGFVDTDMNGHKGNLTVDEGTRIIIKLATLGVDDKTNGAFLEDGGEIQW
eukprot:gene5588-6955_t